MRARFYLLIVATFAVINAAMWFLSYRAATAPSPEELALAAQSAVAEPPSSVAFQRDGFYERNLLTGDCAICAGPWRYLQTGTELTPLGGDLPFFAPGYDDRSWRTMPLPQNWYLAGLNYHGVIWFRQRFTADPAWRGRALNLHFDGVDYATTVWLNGQRVGDHTGSFQPFSFDVSDLLDFDAENVLVVRVDSPYEEYNAVWPNHKTLVKGVFQQHNARPGGAWSGAGQEYNTGGVWGDIWLEASDALAVESLRVYAAWPTTVTIATDDSAHQSQIPTSDPLVSARVALRNFADEPIEAVARVSITPKNFSGPALSLPEQDVSLGRGLTTVTISATAPSPSLWQPWDRGAPNLYTVRAEVMINGIVGATYTTTFGFRQVLVQDGWRWIVNGQPYFVRGANYISSQWLAQVDEAWLRRDIELARNANLNLLRVQAHVEPQAFYRLADEQGLLVWQDFPLQWGYSDAPAFIDQARRQLADMIALLYNHPSIAVWTMHNESPWATPTLRKRIKEYDPRQNKRLDALLAEDARALDPLRFVHESSGSSDAHVTAGWDAGSWRDYADLPGAPFVSEYGAQALPNLAMMEQMFTPQERIYASGEVRTRWEFHDFQPRETFDVAEIDPGESLAEFIANSQAYQANLLQFAGESFRRAKYDPMNGAIQFMLTDAWPAITWSVLDFDRQPKEGYFALQTAMQPVLPSIDATLPISLEGRTWVYTQPEEVTASIWVVNDLTRGFANATLRWQVSDLDSDAALVADKRAVDIAPDSARRWVSLVHLPLAPGRRYRLSVALDDAEGQSLGKNQFDFAIHGEQPGGATSGGTSGVTSEVSGDMMQESAP